MKHLIILFAVTSILYSQEMQIQGVVKSLQSNNPIPFVNISVQGKNVSVQTDDKGYFSLTGISSANDLLIISHIGYYIKELLVKSFLSLDQGIIYLEEKYLTSQTILVKGSVATEGVTPISFSKLNNAQLKQTYTNQDIPEVLSNLPSVNFYSENGNGLGYNYLSIRGFDQRRISVSINGIPQNDPEDHNVYWIDFPDLIESTELIQIQRGAGSGIIGYPAIGGAVNIITTSFTEQPQIELSTSIGNYNTRKYSITAKSGLLNEKYSIYLKLSQTQSTGYRELSWVDMKAYHLSAVRYDDDVTSQINIYGGPISDGLAYTGLPKFAIKDKNLRRVNYSYWETDENNYTYTLLRRSEEIENFSQPHFELLNEIKISENLSFNSALFLVIGDGFFDYDASWADTSYFRLIKEFGISANMNPSNSLIRAMVNNKQWGWIPRASIQHSNGELIIGGEFRFHRSLHWGSIEYANGLPMDLYDGYRYYQYEGAKDILSVYFNENYKMNENINILAEAQLVYNKYRLYNEKFVGTDFSISNLFFNPRIGINYIFNSNISSYLSFARVSREPRLKNYYDAAESSGGEVPQFSQYSNGKYDYENPYVKPESMTNIELGGLFKRDDFSLSLNGYLMIFSDEIVKKGQLDRFGQPITGNMESTTHYGVESSLIWKINNNIEIVFNGAVSKDYISQGLTFVKTKDQTGKKVTANIDLADNTINGFPNSSLNSIIRINYDSFFFQLSSKYVGKMYTDNYSEKLDGLLKLYPSLTSYSDNQVDPFFVVNLFASYELEKLLSFAECKLFLQVNNLFDNLYAAYGIGGEFFPAAERNVLVGLKLSL